MVQVESGLEDLEKKALLQKRFDTAIVRVRILELAPGTARHDHIGDHDHQAASVDEAC